MLSNNRFSWINFFRTSNGIILLLLGTNILLKLLYINAFPLSGDEPFTVFVAQFSLPELYELLKTENNPPFYFLIMKGWISFFGIETPWVRFPSLIFSVFSVVYLYKFGEKFFSRRVGLIASILFTFSSMHMLFSHETRAYSLFVLLAAGSMYYYLNARNNTSKKSFIAYTLFTVLLIYTHFFGLWILFIQAIHCLYTYFTEKKFYKQFLISIGLVCLLYLPYSAILFARFLESSSAGTWITPPGTPMETYYMLIKFFNTPLFSIITLLSFSVTIFLFLKRKIKIKENNLLIILWFTIPFLIMFLVSYIVPMFIYRYLAFVSIGAYFCFAVSLEFILEELKHKWSSLFMLILLFIFSVTLEPYKEKDKRNVVEYIEKVKELKTTNPNLIVLMAPNWTYRTFSYSYNIAYFKDYKNTITLLRQNNIYPINTLSDIDKSLLQKNIPLLIIDDWLSLTDPNQSIYTFLNKQNRTRHEYILGGVKLIYYPIP